MDGALPREKLDADARAEADAWERALDELRAEARPAPADLEERIMADVARAAPVRPRPWLLRPRAVHVTPLSGLLVAAGLAALLLWPRMRPAVDPAGTGVQDIYVQFTLEAPGARSVSIAGDFTGWQDVHALTDPDGDGVWTGRIALTPGVHQYMFVIDGSDWVTDPRAERYTDDGFGNRNAVIAVDAAGEVIG